MDQDHKKYTQYELKKMEALDVFARTVIKRRAINNALSYINKNRAWKELLPLEEEAVNSLQKRKPPLDLALEEGDLVMVSANITLLVEDEALKNALAGMGPKHVQCLVASALLGMDDREIAEKTNLSVNTVRVYRGKTGAGKDGKPDGRP